MVLGICLILLLYVAQILWLTYGTFIVKSFYFQSPTPKTTFSIIIPFRNEANHLPNLLESLASLEYPVALFEILLVDDGSSDTSLEIINECIATSRLNIKLLTNNRNSPSPKKDAILSAITHSSNAWMITTDADCVVPKTWLTALDSFIQSTHPEMVAAPVMLKPKKDFHSSFLYAFETLDFAGLIGSTIGGFGVSKLFMANGANLAYRKTAFFQVGSFDGNEKIASGDDVFLLHKFAKTFPNKIKYLKHLNATVQTSPSKNWRDLFQQRKRWAGKTTSYTNRYAKFMGILVFLGNLATVLGAVYFIYNAPVAAFAKAEVILPSLVALKLLIDFVLIYRTAHFLNVSRSIVWYPIVALVYPFWTIIVAIASLSGSYTWKGRTFSR